MAAKAISTISIAWPASGGMGRPKRSFPPSADELMSAAELAAGASPRPASASAHVPPKASAKPLAGKPAKRAGAAEPAPAPAPVKKSSSAIDLAPRAPADAKPRDDPVGGPPRPALEGVRKALLDPEPPLDTELEPGDCRAVAAPTSLCAPPASVVVAPCAPLRDAS